MDYINKIKQFDKEIDNESDETTIMKINGNQTPTKPPQLKNLQVSKADLLQLQSDLNNLLTNQNESIKEEIKQINDIITPLRNMAEKLNKLNMFVNETTASTSARLLIIEEDMEKVNNDIGKMDKNMSKKILDLTRRNGKLQSNAINIKDKTSTSPLELQENINSLNDN